jgi:N6-L-threonylcarbamoyladenine synthase
VESSCDDTCASVCKNGKILSNIIATQEVHKQYGGVVPELASRAHIQNIVPVVDAALHKAGIQSKDVDGFAYTHSPGLIGSLLVGSQFIKSMALAFDKPLMEVHHMQAHVLANLIADQKPAFPFLCLTVSGGHTQIVLCSAPLTMEVVGQTLDDAAGEAFDKTAKILGLPYPGGPLIDKYAKKGDPLRYHFPEPSITGLDFSFSGLKTAILYFIQNEVRQNPSFIKDNLPDICASVQERIISILLNKLSAAAKKNNISEVCIAGGVSANSRLRQAFQELGRHQHWNTYMPPFEYCTDNAGMIAITAYYKFLENQFASLDSSPSARATW